MSVPSIYMSGGKILGSGGNIFANSGGGGNTDYSNLITVSGIDKGAQSGFLTRGGWSYGSSPTISNYQGGPIFPVTATGTYYLYAETVLGETGSRSVTATTFDATNATAGTNYTSATNTITVTDGQRGKKLLLAITVTAIPTGFGLVGISITGSNAYRSTAWLWLQGTGRVPGAKFFQSSNGVNVNGSTSGSGTQGSPWLGLSHAISTIGATGGVLYWVQNGTNGHMEWGGTAGNNNGISVSGFSAPSNNPLIILPDPANASQAFMDQGSTAGGAAILFSNAPALYFLGTGANLWLCGIHFYRGGVQFNSSDAVSWSNVVLWQCEVDNYSFNAGSNVHCLRYDETHNLIAQDCYFHDSYTTEQGTGVYPYSSVASGAESCVGAFYSGNATFAHCKFARGQNACMYKQASNTITDTPPELTHCVASQCAANSGSAGYLIQYPVQVAATQNGVIRWNVYDGTNDTVSGAGLLLYCSGENTGNSYIDIYNNITIASSSPGGGGLGVFINTTHVRFFNNVSQDSTTTNDEMKIGATGPAQLEVSDYNLFVRGSHTWVLGYGGSSTIYSTLATWQAAPSGTYLQNANPDANSTATSTTPAYGNISTGNYRFTDTGGLGGQARGVGMEYVGIVNNFLNTSLPLAG